MIRKRQYSLVARSYAEALFRAARARGQLAALGLEIAALSAVIERTGGRLVRFMGNPQVSTEAKLALVRKVFGGPFNPMVVRMLELMIARDRVTHLADSLALLGELIERDAGIEQAVVTSAVDLDEPDRERLRTSLERYTKSRLHIRYEVEPKLIGGLVFYYRDTLVDGSLRAGLDEMRRRMQNTTLLTA
jgi:F-type H+-transporting ATPase subunit delta